MVLVVCLELGGLYYFHDFFFFLLMITSPVVYERSHINAGIYAHQHPFGILGGFNGTGPGGLVHGKK